MVDAAKQQYNNTNRGALFVPRSEKAPCNLSGSGNVVGKDVRLDLFKTDGQRCKALLLLKDKEDLSHIVAAVPLYENNNGKAVMYGSFQFGETGKIYVNVFFNDKTQRTDNGPFFTLSFKVAEETQASNNKEDIPF